MSSWWLDGWSCSQSQGFVVMVVVVVVVVCVCWEGGGGRQPNTPEQDGLESHCKALLGRRKSVLRGKPAGSVGSRYIQVGITTGRGSQTE